MSRQLVGETITLSFETKNVLATPPQLQDPNKLTVEVFDPVGSSTVYTFGVSQHLTRISLGRWICDPLGTMPGPWKFVVKSWWGIGATEPIEEEIFPIDVNQV